MYQLQYQDYVDILKDELILAMGCTEPSAIAYCSAVAAQLLGGIPDHMEVTVSGNMIKNAKSVVVPNTDGMKGIPAAAVAGIFAAHPEKKLEILSVLQDSTRARAKEYLAQHPVPVKLYEGREKLFIRVDMDRALPDNPDQKITSAVEIVDHHTNIVLEERNGKALLDYRNPASVHTGNSNGASDGRDLPVEGDVALEEKKRLLSVQNILWFAKTVRLSDVQEVLDAQMKCNHAIAAEGMKNAWGASIGRTLLQCTGNTVRNRAKAYAAAGSDARMSGCEMPVVINSGSGNQGITVSVPVMVYADELGVTRDLLCRALIVSNLISVHIKSGIGALSAFCGAVSAGCAAACGIAYLYDNSYECISHTLTNSIAASSGIICDGAKPSCAAKIALSVESGLLGYDMYRSGHNFNSGEGIVGQGVESTIDNVSDIGAEGMNVTDQEILRIMTRN